jgi:serine/threonine protein kinase
MEYFPEGDLGAYLRDSPPLPEDEACDIIHQALQGLAIMHQMGYAHRDVKPENILIHQRPVSRSERLWWVKLTDFGITKPIGTVVSASAPIGTPGYVAPELLRQSSQSSFVPDYPATDIWSLGATAFYILAGVLPFPDYFNMVEYVASPDTLFPRAKLDERLISTDGSTFIRTLLEPKPEQRPDSKKARSDPWILSHTSTAAAQNVSSHGR